MSRLRYCTSPRLARAAASLLAASLFALSLAASAADYYVSPDGNDERGDGSRSRPWRSLQRAADTVGPGDTVHVADGAYEPFHIETSGKPGRPIRFRAMGTAAVISGTRVFDERPVAISVLASHVVIEGFRVRVSPTPRDGRTRGIRISGTYRRHVTGVHVIRNRVENAGWVGITTSYADDVVIEDNVVSGSYREHGIYLANSGDRAVVRRNIVFDNAEAGIQLNADPHQPGDGISSGNLIAGNVLYRNGRHGSAAINLASVRDSVIANNLIYDNYAQGIAAWDDEAGDGYGSKNNLFAHNTVVMPAGNRRHALSLRHGSTGNVVKNNILLHLGSGDSLAVDASSLPGLVSDHNLLTRIEDTSGRIVGLREWQASRNLDRRSIGVDADTLFVDPGSGNYMIRPGSPAHDAGDPSVGIEADIANTPRPQGRAPDIGAYEIPAPLSPRASAGIQDGGGITKSR